MGHEAIGVVEAVGADVRKLRRGDFVIMPFAYSDGSCTFCHEHLYTSCLYGGFFGSLQANGAQAEAVRVPQADGTLFVVPGGADEALMPGLLTLSDVTGTGYHAAVSARVAPGRKAAIVGDGAVGLCAVIAAKRLGAEQIILLGRHPDRIALAKRFGATDIVSERGEAAIEQLRKLTGGFGVHSVLECVGSEASMTTAIGIVRPGGAIGRVGVPHYEGIPASPQTFHHKVTVGGGPAPGSCLHGAIAARCASRPHRTRARIRSRNEPESSSGRLSRDGPARVDQGHGAPVNVLIRGTDRQIARGNAFVSGEARRDADALSRAVVSDPVHKPGHQSDALRRGLGIHYV